MLTVLKAFEVLSHHSSIWESRVHILAVNFDYEVNISVIEDGARRSVFSLH